MFDSNLLPWPQEGNRTLLFLFSSVSSLKNIIWDRLLLTFPWNVKPHRFPVPTTHKSFMCECVCVCAHACGYKSTYLDVFHWLIFFIAGFIYAPLCPYNDYRTYIWCLNSGKTLGGVHSEGVKEGGKNLQWYMVSWRRGSQAAINPSCSQSTLKKQRLIKISFCLSLSSPLPFFFMFRHYRK